MAKVKSNEEINADINKLQMEIKGLQKEARRMKRLEQQKEAEEKRKRDMAYAVELVEFAKNIRFREGGETYYDFLSRMLAESKENHSDERNSESDYSRSANEAQAGGILRQTETGMSLNGEGTESLNE